MVQESCSGYCSGHFIVKDIDVAKHRLVALVNRYMLALMLTIL